VLPGGWPYDRIETVELDDELVGESDIDDQFAIMTILVSYHSGSFNMSQTGSYVDQLCTFNDSCIRRFGGQANRVWAVGPVGTR